MELFILESQQSAWQHRPLITYQDDGTVVINAVEAVTITGMAAPGRKLVNIVNEGVAPITLAAQSSEVGAAYRFVGTATVPAFGRIGFVSQALGWIPEKYQSLQSFPEAEQDPTGADQLAAYIQPTSRTDTITVTGDEVAGGGSTLVVGEMSIIFDTDTGHLAGDASGTDLAEYLDDNKESFGLESVAHELDGSDRVITITHPAGTAANDIEVTTADANLTIVEKVTLGRDEEEGRLPIEDIPTGVTEGFVPLADASGKLVDSIIRQTQSTVDIVDGVFRVTTGGHTNLHVVEGDVIMGNTSQSHGHVNDNFLAYRTAVGPEQEELFYYHDTDGFFSKHNGERRILVTASEATLGDVDNVAIPTRDAQIRVNFADDKIEMRAGAFGFYGKAAVAQPEIPATPNAQDIADVLVALGLATQAAP